MQKKVKLEMIYMGTVALSIPSTTTFQTFRKVSKNCNEAIKMLHINPFFIFKYIPYLLNVFPNINTLYGNINEISDEVNNEQIARIDNIDSSRYALGTKVKETLF